MNLWPFKKKTKITDSADLLRELEGESDGMVSVSSKSASQLSAVFSCVRVISESIGMLPLSIYEKSGESRKKLNGSLYSLLAIAPNDWMTAQEFWEMAGVHLGFNGNFYAYINRVGDEVVELLPITGMVRKKQGKDFEVWYEVTINGSVTHVPHDNILHIPLFTDNGLTGMSPIAKAKNTFGIAQKSEDLNFKLVGNASRPGGILSTAANLTPEQMAQYQEAWEKKHSGGNNFRTAILGNGFTYTPTSVSSGELQFLEMRKFTRTEIAGLYRIPPHMIADMEAATFSNIENQGQSFVTHCLMPYLTRIENRVRMQLIPKDKWATVYAKFNVGALVRGDMEARGNFYTKLVQNGALSPNEIRELEDRPPRDGGDIYLTPMNMLVNSENLTNPK